MNKKVNTGIKMEKKKILLGLHDRGLRESLKDLLESYELEVANCGTPDCIMRNLSENKYDLVYMDVNLEYSMKNNIEPVLKVRDYIEKNNLETELIGTTDWIPAKIAAKEKRINYVRIKDIIKFLNCKYSNQ